MSTTYQAVAADNAREGDEHYHGGAWHPITAATVLRGNVLHVRYASGGSASAPVHHGARFRRAVCDGFTNAYDGAVRDTTEAWVCACGRHLDGHAEAMAR